MAGPYYVDPAASGSANGSSWTNAWTTLQTALDTAAAGEIIYCRGTQTTAATIDFDTNAGTNAAGWIKVIGCNSSGIVDGTRFILNANGGSYHVVTANGTADMYWLENIEVKNTAAGTYHGFFASAAASTGWVFINCCANTCGARGFSFDATNAPHTIAYRCVAYSNGTNGFYDIRNTLLCVARDNTSDGFQYGTVYFGCVSHGNGDDGFQTATPAFINCVCDGNVDNGIDFDAHTNLYSGFILGCRVTNHSGATDIGINANSEPCITAHCYFEDNDGDNIQNATLHYNIPLENSSNTSNVEDQADTNEGYLDKTNHDFSTNYTSGTDPHLRRTAITLPWT